MEQKEMLTINRRLRRSFDFVKILKNISPQNGGPSLLLPLFNKISQ
jgi:hypothetical protein